jgi:hypothetical protein
MKMNIKAQIEAIYSERDRNGNCYWALRYTSFETGKVVCGTVSGGESNIYAILRETDQAHKANDWDRSISFRCDAMKKREFKRLTGDWKYAGCTPSDLWQFIKTELRSA